MSRKDHADMLPRPVRSAPPADAGFTMVELLIATAVLTLVLGLLVAVIMQLYAATVQIHNRLAVLGDMTLAAQSLARDVNSAAVAVVSDAHHLTLTQPAWEGGAARTVSYEVSPPLLLRSDGSGQTQIARYVQAGTSFGEAGTVTGTQLLSIRLISSLGQETQTTTIQLGLRPQP